MIRDFFIWFDWSGLVVCSYNLWLWDNFCLIIIFECRKFEIYQEVVVFLINSEWRCVFICYIQVNCEGFRESNCIICVCCGLVSFFNSILGVINCKCVVVIYVVSCIILMNIKVFCNIGLSVNDVSFNGNLMNRYILCGY